MTISDGGRRARPAGTVPAMLVLLSSVAVAGCSIMPDLVHSTVPVTTDENSLSAFQTVAEVKARVMVKKKDLAQRMRNQELARNALGLITFGGLATAGIGAAYGADTDLILAGVGAAGLAYGAGQLSTERGYDQVYLAGISALNCIDAVISPVAGSFNLLKTRQVDLNRVIGLLDSEIGTARALPQPQPDGAADKEAENAAAAALRDAGTMLSLRPVADELENEAKKLEEAKQRLKNAADKLEATLGTADKARAAAVQARDQAVLRMVAEPDLANSAIPALVAIDNQLAQQIMQRRPSLEQYFAVLQSVPGFGAGKLPASPSPAREVDASVPVQSPASAGLQAPQQPQGAQPSTAPQEPQVRAAIDTALRLVKAKTAQVTRAADAIEAREKALASAVAAVQNESAVMEAANARIARAPEKFQLGACSFLAPELVVADIAFAPAGPLTVKPGTSQVVQINGGGKNDAFSAVPQKSDVAGVKVMPVGPRNILVDATGQQGNYTLPILVTGTFSGKSAVLEVKGQQ